MRPCTPNEQHVDRHSQIVYELRKRASTEQTKEELEQAQDNGKLKGAGVSTSSEFETKFLLKPTIKQVDEQWARALCKKGLALDLVDNTEFRKAVLVTARAGLSYVDNSDALHPDTQLPHRYKMSKSTIPALEESLDAKVAKRTDGLLQQTGCMLISDGWTSIQSRPITNALLSTPVVARFVAALDTTEPIKDARFIAEFVITIIRQVGPENVIAVCMDGACAASFPLIEKEFGHVHCFICPTHSLDNFLGMCARATTKFV